MNIHHTQTYQLKLLLQVLRCWALTGRLIIISFRHYDPYLSSRGDQPVVSDELLPRRLFFAWLKVFRPRRCFEFLNFFGGRACSAVARKGLA